MRGHKPVKVIIVALERVVELGDIVLVTGVLVYILQPFIIPVILGEYAGELPEGHVMDLSDHLDVGMSGVVHGAVHEEQVRVDVVSPAFPSVLPLGVGLFLYG